MMRTGAEIKEAIDLGLGGSGPETTWSYDGDPLILYSEDGDWLLDPTKEYDTSELGLLFLDGYNTQMQFSTYIEEYFAKKPAGTCSVTLVFPADRLHHVMTVLNDHEFNDYILKGKK